jgi:hypothetical protein
LLSATGSISKQELQCVPTYIFTQYTHPAYNREVNPSSLFCAISTVNCRRMVGSKFLADVGFIGDKTATNVMQREGIKILIGCSGDQQIRKFK